MKDRIEGCRDAPVVVWGKPAFAQSKGRERRKVLICSHVVLLDDLLHGVFHLPTGKRDLRCGVAASAVRRYQTALGQCTACSLRVGRTQVVPMRVGLYRLMVIGEAPGREEDASGEAFVGDAGKLLWGALAPFGLKREHVCTSNVLKCRPPSNKFPADGSEQVCAQRWLGTEVRFVRPLVLFVLGANAAKTVVPGDKRGVDSRNGIVEWNDRLGCWVVYGVHPAALLYARREGPAVAAKREGQLSEACRIFAEVARTLAGIQMHAEGAQIGETSGGEVDGNTEE